jgi:hypothetical protein
VRTPDPRWIASVACVAATLAATPARAQSDAVAAQSMFNEARALLEQGRTEEACALFEKSAVLEPNVGTLLNLGGCHEQRGQLATAWGVYNRALRLAIKRSDPRIANARDEAARIEPRLARVTIALAPGLASTPGLTVTRNGVPVSAAVFDVAAPVDSGEQVIVVRAPRHHAWTDKRVIADGTSVVVRVPVLEADAVDAPRPSSQAKVGLGVGIGGVAAIATGLVLGAVAIGKWSSVTDACPAVDGVALCPSESVQAQRRDDVDSAQTFATVSTIVTSVGLVALATGIVLRLTSPSATHRAAGSSLFTF